MMTTHQLAKQSFVEINKRMKKQVILNLKISVIH